MTMIKIENNTLLIDGKADDLFYEIGEIMRGFIGCFKEEQQIEVAKLLLDKVLYAAIPDDKMREHIAMEGISELLKQAKEDE
jgi:hypothetical protein